MRQASSSSSSALESERAASATHPKWQVQNRVGGGSLYGVADLRGGGGGVAAAASGPSSMTLSPSARPLARAGSNGGMSANSSHGSLGAAAGGPEASTAGGGGSASGAAPRGKMEGVDIVYLKNVLLKFMEAAVTGKVAERDVLLPAVAALLQVGGGEVVLSQASPVTPSPMRCRRLPPSLPPSCAVADLPPHSLLLALSQASPLTPSFLRCRRPPPRSLRS